MNWEKLKQNHFLKEPVEHVYTSTVYDIKDYDKLYENQNNLNHAVWNEFDKKYKTGYQLCEDIRHIDMNREVICVWFFKERNDRSAGEDILLKDKKIKYQPNTFLITKSKDIKIINKQDEYIRRPFIQLDLSNTVWESILKRFDK
jgi:hypothetical protein